MNAEHILDAIGLLDDGLIREAEEYSRPKRQVNYRPWVSLAACLVVVIALGYGVTHLKTGGGSSMNGAAPAASQAGSPAGSAADNESLPPPGEANSGGGEFPEAPAPEPDIQEPLAPGETDTSVDSPNGTETVPAIMVGGVLYRSTGTPFPGEVDESAVRTVTSYINTVPEMDGQTNFSQDLSARYAMTDQGLAVLIEGEWILFEPAPSQQR